MSIRSWMIVRDSERFGLAWAVLVVGMSCAFEAAAETNASNKAAADALFDEARKLMDQGKYGEACPKLEDSDELDPGVGTLLNLGRCYELNGQTASAWSTYREAAARARSGGQTEREQLAREQAAQLEPRLTRVVIQVSPEAKLAGVEVKRDGEVLPEGMWGVPVPVDPGEHVMEATAPGKTPVRATFQVAGEGKTINVQVPALSDAVAENPAAPPVASAPARPASTPGSPPPGANRPAAVEDEPALQPQSQRVLGYVAGALGIAGVATSAVIGLRVNSDTRRAKKLCTGGDGSECSSQSEANRHAALTTTAEDNAMRAYIAAGAGGALLVTGVVLLLTAGSEDDTLATRWSLGPTLDGAGFGVGARTSF